VVKLSVIIPCYNAADTIADQLDALKVQSWIEPWEIIVADNGSTDNTLTIVDQYKSQLTNLHVVSASDRKGAAHARNIGAAVAKGDLLAFCDADDVVAPGWVAAIGAGLCRWDFVASRMEITRLNTSVSQMIYKDFQQQYGLQRMAFPPYFLHAGGCGLGIKRSLHERVAGFDETLGRNMDTDYCIRVQLLGVEFHFTPEAVVHIRLPSESGRRFHQGRVWAVNTVMLYKKYGQRNESAVRLWMRYLRRWIGLLRRLPQLNSKPGRAAWLWSLAWQLGRLQGSIEYWVPPV